MKRLFAVFLMLSILFVLLPSSAHATSSAQDMQLSPLELPLLDEPYGVVCWLVVYLLILGFFCVIEWVISIPFKMHEECKKVIFLTNLITQVGLQAVVVIYFLLCYYCGRFWISFVPHMSLAIPILPYVVEFLIYRDKMLGFTTKEILIYTILANTASMVLWLLGIMNA